MSEAAIDSIARSIGEHPIQYVQIGTPDIDGLFRGKRISASSFLAQYASGFSQGSVLFGWDITDTLLPQEQDKEDAGFGDIRLLPDLSTFKVVPWEAHTASCMCDVSTSKDTLLELSPRALLQRVLAQAQARGYTAQCAAELECYIFCENQKTLREKSFGTDLDPLNPGTHCYVLSHASMDDAVVGTLVRAMNDYGIPIEGYNREHGPGMYEMNLQYAEALEAADRALLFKTGITEVCATMDCTASFMAKWNDQLDGCSGHTHLSLWNASCEENLFWSEEHPLHMSEDMQSFLAGVLALLPACMALYAPTINSYKRYVEGGWTPLQADWGVDHRLRAVRVLNGSAQSTRLELRVPGADANFYLVFAAILASGLHGMEKHLPLHSPEQYFAEHQHLPRTLAEAVPLLDQNKTLRTLLGDVFVDHFVRTRQWECEQYNRAVTDWERRRYLELV